MVGDRPEQTQSPGHVTVTSKPLPVCTVCTLTKAACPTLSLHSIPRQRASLTGPRHRESTILVLFTRCFSHFTNSPDDPKATYSLVLNSLFAVQLGSFCSSAASARKIGPGPNQQKHASHLGQPLIIFIMPLPVGKDEQGVCTDLHRLCDGSAWRGR